MEMVEAIIDNNNNENKKINTLSEMNAQQRGTSEVNDTKMRRQGDKVEFSRFEGEIKFKFIQQASFVRIIVRLSLSI